MDYADLLKRAHDAAKAAIMAEVAREPEDLNAFDCGYAWVILKPARGPFVTFCRKAIKEATTNPAPGVALSRSVNNAEKEYGAVRDYGGGGWQWWMPGRDVFNGQSIRMFEKGAEAFVAVLREAGLNATVGSRLD